MLLLAGVGLAQGQIHPQLYAQRMVGGGAGGYIHVLDAATGLAQQVIPIRGAYSAQLGFLCIAHDGNRLWSLAGSSGPNSAKIARIRQADGAMEKVWATGAQWSWYGMDWLSSTGHFYLLCRTIPLQSQLALYRYDPAVDQMVVVAPITGAFPAQFAFVIDHSGQAFAFDGAGPNMYTVDLATGVTGFHAALGFPAFTGFFWDAAFDASGDLWVSYEDTWTNAETGIYKIDMATLSHTKIIGLTTPFDGLAWGPAPTVGSYCTAKLSSQGCIPSITAIGYPCAVAIAGFTIRATNLPNQKLGLLMYSTTGPQTAPFQGGTLCLNNPLRRTPASSSGGSPLPANDCSGALSLDFNEFVHDRNGAPGPPLPAGTNVCAQWWGRDTGFSAPNDSSLSNAIRFDLAP